MTNIILGCKPWNRTVFNKERLPGKWVFWDKPSQLTLAKVKKLNPDYLFFLHWSWKVNVDIWRDYNCVCFHPTDLPYGRGGTPIQNLIIRGHKRTKLTAFRMTGEFDAGPVYLKKPLSLNGRAEEIYIRATQLSFKMIREILATHPIPKAQFGEVVNFRRRMPEESFLPSLWGVEDKFNFIRMLDAMTYPKAFIIHGAVKMEFSNARKEFGCFKADVTFTKIH